MNQVNVQVSKEKKASDLDPFDLEPKKDVIEPQVASKKNKPENVSVKDILQFSYVGDYDHKQVISFLLANGFVKAQVWAQSSMAISPPCEKRK